MGYRVIFLANPVKLSTKNEQLLIDNGEVTKVPLEDIECIHAVYSFRSAATAGICLFCNVKST